MTTSFDQSSILAHLDELLKLQHDSLVERPRKPADDVRDWRALNFLFRIGREYPLMNNELQQQLDGIFHAWTSPEPLNLRDFSVLLRELRDAIAGSPAGPSGHYPSWEPKESVTPSTATAALIN